MEAKSKDAKEKLPETNKNISTLELVSQENNVDAAQEKFITFMDAVWPAVASYYFQVEREISAAIQSYISSKSNSSSTDSIEIIQESDDTQQGDDKTVANKNDQKKRVSILKHNRFKNGNCSKQQPGETKKKISQSKDKAINGNLSNCEKHSILPSVDHEESQDDNLCLEEKLSGILRKGSTPLLTNKYGNFPGILYTDSPDSIPPGIRQVITDAEIQIRQALTTSFAKISKSFTSSYPKIRYMINKTYPQIRHTVSCSYPNIQYTINNAYDKVQGTVKSSYPKIKKTVSNSYPKRQTISNCYRKFRHFATKHYIGHNHQSSNLLHLLDSNDDDDINDPAMKALKYANIEMAGKLSAANGEISRALHLASKKVSVALGTANLEILQSLKNASGKVSRSLVKANSEILEALTTANDELRKALAVAQAEASKTLELIRQELSKALLTLHPNISRISLQAYDNLKTILEQSHIDLLETLSKASSDVCEQISNAHSKYSEAKVNINYELSLSLAKANSQVLQVLIGANSKVSEILEKNCEKINHITTGFKIGTPGVSFLNPEALELKVWKVIEKSEAEVWKIAENSCLTIETAVESTDSKLWKIADDADNSLKKTVELVEQKLWNVIRSSEWKLKGCAEKQENTVMESVGHLIETVWKSIAKHNMENCKRVSSHDIVSTSTNQRQQQQRLYEKSGEAPEPEFEMNLPEIQSSLQVVLCYNNEYYVGIPEDSETESESVLKLSSSKMELDYKSEDNVLLIRKSHSKGEQTRCIKQTDIPKNIVDNTDSSNLRLVSTKSSKLESKQKVKVKDQQLQGIQGTNCSTSYVFNASEFRSSSYRSGNPYRCPARLDLANDLKSYDGFQSSNSNSDMETESNNVLDSLLKPNETDSLNREVFSLDHIIPAETHKANNLSAPQLCSVLEVTEQYISKKVCQSNKSSKSDLQEAKLTQNFSKTSIGSSQSSFQEGGAQYAQIVPISSEVLTISCTKKTEKVDISIIPKKFYMSNSDPIIPRCMEHGFATCLSESSLQRCRSILYGTEHIPITPSITSLISTKHTSLQASDAFVPFVLHSNSPTQNPGNGDTNLQIRLDILDQEAKLTEVVSKYSNSAEPNLETREDVPELDASSNSNISNFDVKKEDENTCDQCDHAHGPRCFSMPCIPHYWFKRQSHHNEKVNYLFENSTDDKSYHASKENITDEMIAIEHVTDFEADGHQELEPEPITSAFSLDVGSVKSDQDVQKTLITLKEPSPNNISDDSDWENENIFNMEFHTMDSGSQITFNATFPFPTTPIPDCGQNEFSNAFFEETVTNVNSSVNMIPQKEATVYATKSEETENNRVLTATIKRAESDDYSHRFYSESPKPSLSQEHELLKMDSVDSSSAKSESFFPFEDYDNSNLFSIAESSENATVNVLSYDSNALNPITLTLRVPSSSVLNTDFNWDSSSMLPPPPFSIEQLSEKFRENLHQIQILLSLTKKTGEENFPDEQSNNNNVRNLNPSEGQDLGCKPEHSDLDALSKIQVKQLLEECESAWDMMTALYKTTTSSTNACQNHQNQFFSDQYQYPTPLQQQLMFPHMNSAIVINTDEMQNFYYDQNNNNNINNLTSFMPFFSNFYEYDQCECDEGDHIVANVNVNVKNSSPSVPTVLCNLPNLNVDYSCILPLPSGDEITHSDQDSVFMKMKWESVSSTSINCTNTNGTNIKELALPTPTDSLETNNHNENLTDDDVSSDQQGSNLDLYTAEIIESVEGESGMDIEADADSTNKNNDDHLFEDNATKEVEFKSNKHVVEQPNKSSESTRTEILSVRDFEDGGSKYNNNDNNDEVLKDNVFEIAEGENTPMCEMDLAYNEISEYNCITSASSSTSSVSSNSNCVESFTDKDDKKDENGELNLQCYSYDESKPAISDQYQPPVLEMISGNTIRETISNFMDLTTILFYEAARQVQQEKWPAECTQELASNLEELFQKSDISKLNLIKSCSTSFNNHNLPEICRTIDSPANKSLCDKEYKRDKIQDETRGTKSPTSFIRSKHEFLNRFIRKRIKMKGKPKKYSSWSMCVFRKLWPWPSPQIRKRKLNALKVRLKSCCSCTRKSRIRMTNEMSI